MIEDLVSIIVPCYNGEKYISRFLDSIINQTYKKIELIIIDDGSTDNTHIIIEGYREKLKNEGMNLKYIYQTNQGQAEALNKGLEIVMGEYLTWLDSDDILTKDSIEKKVNFLKKNFEYGFVVSSMAVYDENDLNNIKHIKRWKNKERENYFEDLILEKNIIFNGHLTKSNCFFESNKSKRNYIYPSREGQNWQMLLPLAYNYKCGYINEPLYKYIVRKNSHSREKRNYYDWIKRYENFELLLLETLKRIDMKKEDEEYYIKLIKNKTRIQKMNIYFKAKKYKKYCENYKKIELKNLITLKHVIKYMISKFYVNKS